MPMLHSRPTVCAGGGSRAPMTGRWALPASRRCVAAAVSTSSSVSTTKTAVQRRIGKAQTAEAQATILTALNGVKGRGKSGLGEDQRAGLEDAVAMLEADGGVRDATADAELLDGRWRLLYTSRPGTASPIQNTFTGVDAFSVFQEVDLAGDEVPRITNVVDFGPAVGYLRVEALASTDSRPLDGFTPRKGAGIPLFGKSFVYPPARRNMRIDFQFDKAAFYFNKLPFTIPYPVPFRLLGDETKGFLDVTYVSPDGSFRLSRGNKGTLFVLARERCVKDQLRAAIAAKDDRAVLDLVPFMALENAVDAPAKSPLADGRWRLVWTQQAPGASALQKFGTSQAESYQIIDSERGSLQNVVNIGGGVLELRATASCGASSDVRTDVFDSQAAFSILGRELPMSRARSQSERGFVDWLYLDDDMRITRGSKGSLFIHVREEA